MSVPPRFAIFAIAERAVRIDSRLCGRMRLIGSAEARGFRSGVAAAAKLDACERVGFVLVGTFPAGTSWRILLG